YSTFLYPYSKNFSSLKELINSEKKDFVNVIVSQYIKQFANLFKNRFVESLEDIFNDNEIKKDKLEEYRLKKVLEGSFDKNLFLLGHYDCIGNLGYYRIDLKRIDTPRKALEWTIIMGENNWFNFNGWKQILVDLYGRTPV
ncbi:MAG: hypothetical protein QW103_02555, partial [Candidatus Pacearchaeota archaeon]